MKIEKTELLVGDTWYFCAHFPEGNKSPDCEKCKASQVGGGKSSIVTSIDKDTGTVNFDLIPDNANKRS